MMLRQLPVGAFFFGGNPTTVALSKPALITNRLRSESQSARIFTSFQGLPWNVLHLQLRHVPLRYFEPPSSLSPMFCLDRIACAAMSEN